MNENQSLNIINDRKIRNILAKGGIFIWDISALCSIGFYKCLNSIWDKTQIYKKSFLVPIFIKEQLKYYDVAYHLIDSDNSTAQTGVNNYSDLMKQFKEQGITKINVFVNDVNVKNQINDDGEVWGISLCFYSITNDGVIQNFIDMNCEGKDNSIKEEIYGEYEVDMTEDDFEVWLKDFITR